MPMALEEFKKALATWLPDGSIYSPPDHNIEEYYKGYLTLVEMMGEDGKVGLYQESDGSIRAYFRPQGGLDRETSVPTINSR